MRIFFVQVRVKGDNKLFEKFVAFSWKMIICSKLLMLRRMLNGRGEKKWEKLVGQRKKCPSIKICWIWLSVKVFNFISLNYLFQSSKSLLIARNRVVNQGNNVIQINVVKHWMQQRETSEIIFVTFEQELNFRKLLNFTSSFNSIRIIEYSN